MALVDRSIGTGWAMAAATIAVCAVWIAQPERDAHAAQAPACLHGDNEAPGELQRRRDAVAFMRGVNNAEARAYRTENSFKRLPDLGDVPPIPAGFAAHLAVEREVYAVAVKDTLDPCGFAYFSDQNGLIYTGRPLQ
jgi:hypothetical protein